MAMSRRKFLGAGLRGMPLLALAPTVPGFLARTARGAAAEPGGRVLVVIQLDGGNDGLNTVVPFADDGYAARRRALRLPADRVLKIADGVGLNPAMGDAAKLLESGRLAIVQGVGYPNPSRSHFASMATWHAARLDPEEHGGPGWIGRGLDLRDGDSSLFVGEGNVPAALRARRASTGSLASLDDLQLDPTLPRADLDAGTPAADPLAEFARRSALDAYATADRLATIARRRDPGVAYPGSDLARRLRLVAQLLKGDAGARVFYLNQNGYDTHSAQLFAHAGLLGELSAALRAFLDDLAASGLGDRVIVLAFSEFGRRVAENDSAGTDHGTAGPVLVAGTRIRAGLVGAMPSLSDLDSGDLKTSIDFRRVYATLLDGWLGLPSREVLGDDFERLPILS